MYTVAQLCVIWKGLHTMRLFTFGNLKLANIQFMTKLRPVGLQMDSINRLEPPANGEGAGVEKEEAWRLKLRA